MLLVPVDDQDFLEALGSSAHNCSNVGFDLSNNIIRRLIITVKHHKLQLLHLFEVVRHGDACGKVGVQVVVNGFSLSEKHPFVVREFEDLALGVRLCEHVKILEITP